MICEYHRPNSLDETLNLLSRSTIHSYPLGGGTVLSQYKGLENIAVVDLQNLGLNKIHIQPDEVSIDACVTLQQLLQAMEQPAYKEVIELESSLNNRQRATIAGVLVSADGRSTLATMMLALNVKLTWMPGENEIPYELWLPERKNQGPRGIISRITYTPPEVISFDHVSRTPRDKPILCVAICQWNSSILRIALGGYGQFPILLYAGNPNEYSIGTNQSFLDASDDEWASSVYRKHLARILTNRIIKNIS